MGGGGGPHKVIRPAEVLQRDVVAAEGVADEAHVLMDVRRQGVVVAQHPPADQQCLVVVQQRLAPSEPSLGDEMRSQVLQGQGSR